MLNIYYSNENDYNNKNRFFDLLENNSNEAYNSFVSPNAVDFFYKENDRLQTIKVNMPDFIPLSVTSVGLKPNSFTASRVLNNGVLITYYNDNNNGNQTSLPAPITSRN